MNFYKLTFFAITQLLSSICSIQQLSKNVSILDEPNFAYMVRSTDLEKLDFEKKQRSNSGLFRVVLTKKSWFSMRKFG